MKGEDFSNIVRSTAFTIFVATVCTVVLFHQLPVLVKSIKAIKKDDNN